MGADFISATWSVRRGKTEEATQARARTMLDKALAEINGMAEVPQYFVDEFNYEPDELERLKEQLFSDVEEIRSAFENRHRQGAREDFGKHAVLITGGMSWGDDPTELFGSVCRLVNSGLLKDERK